jgi:hypothetical protein
MLFVVIVNQRVERVRSNNQPLQITHFSALQRSLRRSNSGRSGVSRSATAVVASLRSFDKAEVVLLLHNVLAAGRVDQLRQADLWQADVWQAQAFFATSTTTIGNCNNALSGWSSVALCTGQTAVCAAVAGIGNASEAKDENKSEAQD